MGILQANSFTLSQIAGRHDPALVEELSSGRVALYQPILAQALQGWQTVTARVILDGVMVFGDRWQVFRLSLAHGGRAIPMVWVVLPSKGLTQVEKLETLLTRAAEFLNPRVKRVVFLADIGFRDCDWAHLCLKIGWNYDIRIARNTYMTLKTGWYGSIQHLGGQTGTTPLLSAGLVDPRPKTADEFDGNLDARG